MRRMIRKIGRYLLRSFLWLALVLVLALLPLLAMLGSESGSRWLLEQGLGMQRLITARYQSGTWLSGLELQDVNIRTRSTHVYIRHALARWTIVQLLRGTFQVESLHIDQLDIHLLKPPSGKPIKLPLIVLPFTLSVDDLAVASLRIIPWQSTHPFELKNGEASASWSGTRIVIHHVKAHNDLLGVATLQGLLHTKGDYEVSADGTFDMRWLYEKGLSPLRVHLRQSLADLQLKAESRGTLTASLQGRAQLLEPEVPYVATIEWKSLRLPWLTEQRFYTKGGKAHLNGNKHGLRSTGSANFTGIHLPDAQYNWQVETNWHTLTIDSLKMKGAIGQATAKGQLSWQRGLDWNLNGQFQQLELARHWTMIPAWVTPAMTGTVETQAHMRDTGSTLSVLLKTQNGEQWRLDDSSKTRPWDIHSPHQGRIQWQQISRQLPSIGNISSQKGDMQYQGNLSAYRLMLNSDLHSSQLPSGTWSGDISGKDQNFYSENLHYHGEEGDLRWQGEVNLGHTIRWKGSADVIQFTTKWFQPDWPATLTGHVNTQGQWGHTQRAIQLEDTQLFGQLRDQDIQVEGDLYFRLPAPHERLPEVNAKHMHMVWGGNTVELEGGRNLDQWDAVLTFDVNSPRLLNERLQGNVKGSAVLQGKAQSPDVLIDLTAKNFGLENFFVKDMSLALELPELGTQPGHASLEASGITLAGYNLAEVSATLTGSQDSHRLYWDARTIHTTSRGELSGQYSSSTGQWKGQVENGQFSLPEFDWRLMQPFNLAWLSKEKQLSLGAHCWTSQQSRFCNEEEALLGSTGHFRFTLNDLESERLTGLLPQGLVVKGMVNGTINGDWLEGQRPAAQAQFTLGSGQLNVMKESDQTALVLPFHGASLQLNAGQEKVQAHFNLASDTLGQGDLNLDIDPYSDHKTLQGQIAVNGLRLEVAQPFFPAFSTLAGAVSVNGQIGGTLKSPQFAGAIQLMKGELGLYKLPVNLHDVETRVDIAGSQATLTGSLMSGDGKAAITGQANWQDSFRMQASLKGHDLELRQQPELLATIDPNLDMVLVPGRIDLTGSILMPMARLNIKSLSSDAVPLSTDVVFVDDNGLLPIQTTQQVSNWEINADIGLKLGDDVFFHGYGVNGRLMGGLRLRQQGKKGLEASGEVELDKDARYDAYGQRLQIRRGRLIFAGNLTQPGLDAEAVREVDNETVGVRIEGRANAPKVTFFSDDGGLSQEEIISYLVLGRPLDQQNGENNLSAAAAAIKLGATGGASVTSKLGETLGITDLALDAEGSGDDTQVTVSGYLSPKLYLRYGVGIFTPVNTATLRYKINSKLYLEAVSSLENAIDLFYSFRF